MSAKSIHGRRLATGLATVVALVAVAGQGYAPTAPSGPRRCGITTLTGTIVFDSGTLRCGPGQRVSLHEELHKASKSGVASPIASFIEMGGAQITDSESPLRTELLDACGAGPTSDYFRLNETLLPALLNSTVLAADDIARQGAPVTHSPIEFAVHLGDATDSGQYNELRRFIDIMDGGATITPDSGAPGYEGNQSSDPYPSPVSGSSLLDLAMKPFWAPGLRRADGSRMPWFAVAGTHDVKVHGSIPNSDQLRLLAAMIATGKLMISALPPDQADQLCANPSILADPAFLTHLLLNPKVARLVTPDANRSLVSRQQWATEHANTRGVPAGHGLSDRTRCKDSSGSPLARLCYSLDLRAATPGEPPIHLIALDDSPDTQGDSGDIDQQQWIWLRNDLNTHSACAYPAADAPSCSNKTRHSSSLIIVLSNHASASETNSDPTTTTYAGGDLEKLLLEYPNVILHLDAHAKAGGAIAHSRPAGGGYWEMTTSTIADYPHTSRVVEIADNHDGSISIYGTNFDAQAPVDPQAMGWTNGSETLASIARWVGANDPQSGAGSTPAVTDRDRNVELVLGHPTGGVRAGGVVSPHAVTMYLPLSFSPPFPFGGRAFPTLPGGYQFPMSGSTVQITPPISNFDLPSVRTRSLGSPGHSGRLPTSWYMVFALAILGPIWLFRARVRRSQIGL